jgi:hypothetical protein
MAIYMGELLPELIQHLNANMFHYNADSTDGEIVVPGTAIKVIAFKRFKRFKKSCCW